MGTRTTVVTVSQILIVYSGGEIDVWRFSVWSNFEIGDMDLWRSEAYMKFFEYLDQKGGFYYEVRGSSCVRKPLTDCRGRL